MLELMIEHGLATTRDRPAGGPQKKVTLRLNTQWQDLRDDLRRLKAGELDGDTTTATDSAQRVAFLRRGLAEIG
jgi:hypothetical protein